MRWLRRGAAVAALALAALVLSGGGASLYYGSSPQACGSCHEIRPMVDSWAGSTHRSVACEECHGRSLSAQVRMHLRNAERVVTHLRGEVPEQIRLRRADVTSMVERCAGCHRQEGAEWRSGPHGTRYAAIFLDADHNRRQRLMDDCLRCHAMHFEGGISALVTPVDSKGPWRFVDPAVGGEPAIPCLTCHAIHRPGEPLKARATRGPQPGAGQEIVRPSLAFFDRRSLGPVPVADLPLPALRDGERVVRMSPDRRQGLCYQCHAPRAEGQVFSGDDRTPVGVHEGLSCQACHQTHGLSTRASCAACHPRLSNCGLDVETMDTTYKSPKSPHDVHRVKCADCHPKGVPEKRRQRL
jgi:hypothetical protein